MLFAPLSIIRGLRNHGFDGALGAHLVEVLGNPTDRLSGHHVNHAQQLRPAGCHRNQHHQRKDLQQRSNPEGEPQAVARTDPTAIQVRDHPEELIKEKQEGDLEGGVAELVEMEHHQHPQRTIGERERPVVGGHNSVLLQSGELHASSPTT